MHSHCFYLHYKFLRVVAIVALLASSMSGCSRIPVDVELDHRIHIETGQSLINLIHETREALTDAVEIAGEQSRQTITQAIHELDEYSSRVVVLMGDQLSRNIRELSSEVQAQLRLIQRQTEQLHRYAIDIVEAAVTGADHLIERAVQGIEGTIQEGGRELRETIAELESGTRRAIVDTSLGAVYVVEGAADLATRLGGIFGGLILTFIVMYGWGRIMYGQGFPRERLRRRLAMGFMTASIVVAISPFSLLVPAVRAYAMTPLSATQVYSEYSVVQSLVDPNVHGARPRVYVVPVAPPTPDTLYLVGSRLNAWGRPTVTFGDFALDTSIGSDRIDISIAQVMENPTADSKIVVVFEHDGRTPIVQEISVHTATPTHTPTPTDTPTPTPTPTDTPIPTPTPTDTPTPTVTPDATGTAVAAAEAEAEWRFNNIFEYREVAAHNEYCSDACARIGYYGLQSGYSPNHDSELYHCSWNAGGSGPRPGMNVEWLGQIQCVVAIGIPGHPDYLTSPSFRCACGSNPQLWKQVMNVGNSCKDACEQEGMSPLSSGNFQPGPGHPYYYCSAQTSDGERAGFTHEGIGCVVPYGDDAHHYHTFNCPCARTD